MLPDPLSRTALRIAGHALTVHDALCLAAAAACLLLGVAVLGRERRRGAGLAYFLLAGSAALWLGSLALVRSAPDPDTADRWSRAALVGFAFAPALLYRFASELLDRPGANRWAGGLLWLAAGALAVAGLATEEVASGVAEASWGFRVRLTPGGVAATAALTLAAVGLSLRDHLAVFRRTAPGIRRREIATFLVAFALGAFALVDVLPAAGVEVYPFGYVAVAAGLGVAAHGLRRYQLAAYQPDVAAREVLESVGDPLLVVDREREVHFANYAACRMFGYGRRELPGMPVERLAGDDEDTAAVLRELTREDVALSRELTLRDASGEPVEASVTASRLPAGGGGRAGAVLVVRDVSDRLEAERRLRKSEERYALAARGASDGLWDWDLRADRVHYSARWAAMLGLDHRELSDDPEEWLGRIHPDDRGRVRAEIAAHLRGDTAHLRTEYRIGHADGGRRWMLCRGLAVRDDATGEPRRMAGSQRDVTDRRRARQRLRHEALHDELTGLPNRAFLHDRLGESIQAFRGDPRRLFALLHLDVDRFARINETYGHPAGDEVLAEIAGRLEEVAGGDGDLLARLSGDEFAVLLADIAGAEEAVDAAVRIDRLLEERTFRVEEREIHLSATIGAAVARTDYRRPDQVLRDAEIAMNSAKSDHRRGFALFRPSMRKMPANRLAVESDLRRALADGAGLFMEYQPIVEFARSGADPDAGTPRPARLVAVEGLVRWNHPDRGRLGANEFVPVAEEVGLAGELGRWIIREACRQMADWRRSLGERAPAKVHVNLSPEDIGRRGTVDLIRDTLEAEGLPGECLDVEITEQALVTRPREVARSLAAIRELGASVSIDDFGTGHASFGHLRRFPADTVKIDREFVDPVAHSQRDREIVRSILELADSLELDAITEGVEDEEQVRTLRALGVRLGQGYFWSRPLGAARLAREAGRELPE